MNFPESTIEEFLKNRQAALADKKIRKGPVHVLDDFPLSKIQCLYVINYKENKISYCKGTFEFLGYTAAEFDAELIHQYIHPEDIDMVHRLIRAAVWYATATRIKNDGYIFITFRVRKKDGTYVKVLRQSNIFETDSKGGFISNVSLLTDISFMKTGNRVDWEFKAKKLDEKNFRKYIQREYFNFFTKRELDVLKRLKQGLSSMQIAAVSNISKHTVDTFRRNMLRKAGVKNSQQLLEFCDKNGIEF